MPNFAIGTLPLPYDYVYRDCSAPPLSCMTDYVQANYVIIGSKDFALTHNESFRGGAINPDYAAREFHSFTYDADNNAYFHPIVNSIYTFNCQQVASFAYTYPLKNGGTVIPLTGFEIFFTQHPNAPVNSNYGYSGVMEIGEISQSFEGWSDEPTSCEFVGIVDMDFPSALLLDNFDAYIPKIRYGVYVLGNYLKMVVNGAVIKEGEFRRGTGYASGGQIARYSSHADWTKLTSADYPNVLRGNYPILIDWYLACAGGAVAIAVEISPYNCKYVNLQQGFRKYGRSGAIALGGLVTTNYQNSMPSLIIS